MPKEITHWLASMHAARALRRSVMGRAAVKNRNLLKFGAIYPDLLFHLPGRPAYAPHRRIADALHGTRGEDTYDLIRLICAARQKSPHKEPLLAFLLGVITHIHTDAAFHPMVCYFAGNGRESDPAFRSEAIRQHRLFEVLIDLHFCGGSRNVRRHDIEAILRGLEMPLDHILGLPILPYGAADHRKRQEDIAMRALGNVRILRRYSSRPSLSGFLAVAAKVLPRAQRELISLFYAPQLDRLIPRVSGVMEYRHPITGHVFARRLSDLLHEAVARSAHLAGRIEETLTGTGTQGWSERGPSLSYGLIGATAEEAVHFAKQPFFR